MRTVPNTNKAEVETLTSSPDCDLLVFLKKKIIFDYVSLRIL